MDYLNLDEIGRIAPSVLTQTQSGHLSHIYKHIPTTEVIDILGENGWNPTQVMQSATNSGGEARIPYKKHIVRFRNADNDNIAKEIGDTFPEIVLTNSHNGTSSFKFHVGLFRLVCSNGLVIADQTFNQYKIRHKGFEKSAVIDAISEVTTNIPMVVGKVQGMMGKILTPSQQRSFARQAVIERWGEERWVDLSEVLDIRRSADKGTDLWTVFNRVQENMLDGGISTHTTDSKGRIKLNKTRKVKSIDENLRVNKMLWSLSEAMV